MDDTRDWLTLFLVAAAALSVVVGWFKVLRPRYRRGRTQFVAARDSIIGRPAVYDSITGVEREPALPGVGVRLANQEHSLSELSKAVALLANQHIVLDDHEKRLGILEAASVERVVSRAESAAGWRAMEAAVKAKPDEDVELEP